MGLSIDKSIKKLLENDDIRWYSTLGTTSGGTDTSTLVKFKIPTLETLNVSLDYKSIKVVIMFNMIDFFNSRYGEGNWTEANVEAIFRNFTILKFVADNSPSNLNRYCKWDFPTSSSLKDIAELLDIQRIGDIAKATFYIKFVD